MGLGALKADSRMREKWFWRQTKNQNSSSLPPSRSNRYVNGDEVLGLNGKRRSPGIRDTLLTKQVMASHSQNRALKNRPAFVKEALSDNFQKPALMHKVGSGESLSSKFTVFIFVHLFDNELLKSSIEILRFCEFKGPSSMEGVPNSNGRSHWGWPGVVARC